MEHTESVADPVATISARVKQLRGRHGWTAQQLGERMTELGVPWDRSIVANLENGRRRTVSVVEWLALARALDVSPVHLLVEPEGPGADASKARDPYQVTPTEAASKEDARAWIRGMTSLPGADLRIFYSEVPAEEWGYIWALAKKPADVEPDARFSEPGKWLRRAYGGYGNPDVTGQGGNDGERR